MSRIATIAVLFALATGCIFVEGDDHDYYPDPGPFVPALNEAPYVLDAFAGCDFDAYTGEDIIFFDADVTDPNGDLDVMQVWADVYDDYSGELVESLPLYPEDGGYWFSDWIANSTYVDCWYGGYSVDIVAYDSLDAYDAYTILFDSYR